MKTIAGILILTLIVLVAAILGGVEKGYIEQSEGARAALTVTIAVFAVMALHDLAVLLANKIIKRINIKAEQENRR